ncbi:helix-turn-helix domain-containing protein [Chloroflexota bacterium]
MEEFEQLFTVEDIAKMTSLTSRTIRNYLKNDTLQGSKIGGQWRFTMENIRQLFDNSTFSNDLSRKNRLRVLNFVNNKIPGNRGDIRICTIIDYFCESQNDGHRMYEKLVTAINNKPEDSSPAEFDYEYIDKDSKARFTLFGNSDFIIKSLQQIQ